MSGSAPSGLVCIAKCLDVSQAQVMRGRLDAAGIPTIVFDEHLRPTAWHLLFALGGVRVMVPALHGEEARALLEVHEKTTDAEGESCAQCGSLEVARLYSWIGVPVSLAVAIPFLFGRSRRRCRGCGHAWRI